jgi:hypothetical protein
MGKLKEYYEDFLSAIEFDLMFDDEYDEWLKNKNRNENQYYIDLIKELNKKTDGRD